MFLIINGYGGIFKIADLAGGVLWNKASDNLKNIPHEEEHPLSTSLATLNSERCALL